MMQHYDNGEQIVTDEPCLNCTCRDNMLMCFLKVCPYVRPLGKGCTTEKAPGDCCPTVTCDQVEAMGGALGKRDSSWWLLMLDYNIQEVHVFVSMRVPSDPSEPCDICYCIRNHTACVQQECTMRVPGCRPVFTAGVCCPVRYDCDFETTTLPPLTTMRPDPAAGCLHNGLNYTDGEQIAGEDPCRHCYCMHGEVKCAVQDCATPLDHAQSSCRPVPPPAGNTTRRVQIQGRQLGNDLVPPVNGGADSTEPGSEDSSLSPGVEETTPTPRKPPTSPDLSVVYPTRPASDCVPGRGFARRLNPATCAPTSAVTVDGACSSGTESEGTDATTEPGFDYQTTSGTESEGTDATTEPGSDYQINIGHRSEDGTTDVTTEPGFDYQKTLGHESEDGTTDVTTEPGSDYPTTSGTESEDGTTDVTTEPGSDYPTTSGTESEDEQPGEAEEENVFVVQATMMEVDGSGEDGASTQRPQSTGPESTTKDLSADNYDSGDGDGSTPDYGAEAGSGDEGDLTTEPGGQQGAVDGGDLVPDAERDPGSGEAETDREAGSGDDPESATEVTTEFPSVIDLQQSILNAINNALGLGSDDASEEAGPSGDQLIGIDGQPTTTESSAEEGASEEEKAYSGELGSGGSPRQEQDKAADIFASATPASEPGVTSQPTTESESPGTGDAALDELLPAVPGEGSCLVEGVTYAAGAQLPTSSQCQIRCFLRQLCREVEQAPVALQCYLEGNIYAENDVIVHPDPCKYCLCLSGEVTISISGLATGPEQASDDGGLQTQPTEAYTDDLLTPTDGPGEGAPGQQTEPTEGSGDGTPEQQTEPTEESGEGAPEQQTEPTEGRLMSLGEGAPEQQTEPTDAYTDGLLKPTEESGEGAPEQQTEPTDEYTDGLLEPTEESGEGAPEQQTEPTEGSGEGAPEQQTEPADEFGGGTPEQQTEPTEESAGGETDEEEGSAGAPDGAVADSADDATPQGEASGDSLATPETGATTGAPQDKEGEATVVGVVESESPAPPESDSSVMDDSDSEAGVTDQPTQDTAGAGATPADSSATPPDQGSSYVPAAGAEGTERYPPAASDSVVVCTDAGCTDGQRPAAGGPGSGPATATPFPCTGSGCPPAPNSASPDGSTTETEDGTTATSFPCTGSGCPPATSSASPDGSTTETDDGATATPFPCTGSGCPPAPSSASPDGSTTETEDGATSTSFPCTGSGCPPAPSSPEAESELISVTDEVLDMLATVGPDAFENATDITDAEPHAAGACLFDGKVYVSAQQIPRDNPCDFCFCFRGDIICLQQSCPPPVAGCLEQPIEGFCCPRYECPVESAWNASRPEPTTESAPAAEPAGCRIQGAEYGSGQLVESASGPCLECRCGDNGQMSCDPRSCEPQPLLKKMMITAAHRRR
ncbi:mucin-5AC-like [Pollicipes pollicipes]|uniref:mucin-5AC-like n=1 Tax=Pollicipes pollicipes TaxID=41117 RepID=UPI0018849A43|nr:mucin-5AC-like [Pollicipes pollicipes]